MRFQVAKNRFHNKRIVYPEKGRALGNGTYLRKINDTKYEVWMAFSMWTQNENQDWIRSSKEVSLFTIEPYGDETLLTITNTKYDDLTASFRLRKWTGVSTVICAKELRFFTKDGYQEAVYSLPVMTEGLQFIVDNLGKTRLKEGQALLTSVRFINKEKAKPVNDNYKKLLKFGQMLTALESVTYEDARHKKSEPYLSEVKRVLSGEIEPTFTSVCDLVWSDLRYNERNESDRHPNAHPVNNQRAKFVRGLVSLKKFLYKEIGVYQSKEYKA